MSGVCAENIRKIRAGTAKTEFELRPYLEWRKTDGAEEIGDNQSINAKPVQTRAEECRNFRVWENMAPRIAASAADSIFNCAYNLAYASSNADRFAVTSLFLALPRNTRPQAFTQCAACLFSTSPALETIAKKKKKRKVHRYIEPYRATQARQRKAANIARQEVLGRERQEAMGDPVRSTPTPFITSLSSKQLPAVVSDYHLNYSLTPTEMEKALDYSQWLTEPLPIENQVLRQDSNGLGRSSSGGDSEDPKAPHDADHQNAERALAAIAALENSSSRDRTRINVQRCIEEFGRHKTDGELPSKTPSIPLSYAAAAFEAANKETIIPRQRAGADTGSSEVQAAILTARINVLADNLHNKDKHNKRRLRLMVHKRQKLLSYLRRKERGGPRWQNLVEKLGISDAMWKGEISL